MPVSSQAFRAKKSATTLKFYPGLDLRGLKRGFFGVLVKKKLGHYGVRVAQSLPGVEFQPKSLKPTL